MYSTESSRINLYELCSICIKLSAVFDPLIVCVSNFKITLFIYFCAMTPDFFSDGICFVILICSGILIIVLMFLVKTSKDVTQRVLWTSGHV